MRFIEQNTGMFIEITEIPWRKKQCLLIGQGNEAHHVATFRNEFMAEETKEFLDSFLHAIT